MKKLSQVFMISLNTSKNHSLGFPSRLSRRSLPMRIHIKQSAPRVRPLSRDLLVASYLHARPFKMTCTNNVPHANTTTARLRRKETQANHKKNLLIIRSRFGASKNPVDILKILDGDYAMSENLFEQGQLAEAQVQATKALDGYMALSVTSIRGLRLERSMIES